MTRKILVKNGYEAWAIWDGSAKVWEIFASPDGGDYIGCADTIPEAVKVAHRWINDAA